MQRTSCTKWGAGKFANIWVVWLEGLESALHFFSFWLEMTMKLYDYNREGEGRRIVLEEQCAVELREKGRKGERVGITGE